MPTEQSIDYEAVLADLEAKRVDLDNVIAGIRRILGLLQGGVDIAASPGPAPKPAPMTHGPQEVRPESFLGLTVINAIKKFLRMAGSKQATDQIASALLRGGIETNSADFPRMVRTILHRLHKQGEEVVRVKGGWGLVEWYGPHIRRQVNGKDREAKRPKRRRLSKQKAKAPKASHAPSHDASS